MTAGRRRRRDPFRVGLVVLVVGALATFAGVTRFNPLHHGYRIHALFTSALSNGIHSGAPVRIDGVDVGRVTGVDRGPGSLVDVTLEVADRGRPVHADATVKARPRILLEGNYFLDLSPGSGAAPQLPAGATIPVTQTAVPVQFDQVVDVFTSDVRESNRRLLRGLAQSLEHGGAGALREDYRAAGPALRDGSVTLQAFRGSGDRDLAAFVRRQADLSATLDANNAELADLLTGYRQTLDALAARSGQLAATVPAIDRLLARTPASLRQIRAALPPLRRLSDALEPALRIAPPILGHGIAFVAELRRALGVPRLDRLVRELGPTTTRLHTLERTLPPLFGFVAPVSRCTRDRVLPILASQVDDGALSTHQPVWQDLIHGAEGLLSAQQNFGGDGYSTRFSFGIDQNAVATRVPLGNDLVELTDSPLVGARPLWTPGHQPPYRPDVPCETQPLQSTKARMARAPQPFASVRLHPAGTWTATQLRAHLRQALRRAGARP